MKIDKKIHRVFAFAVFCVGFAGYSFMSASTTWTPACCTPPNGNVDAPINVGTATQIKNGDLGVNTLSVTGNLGVTDGYISVNNTKPSTNSFLKITNNNDTNNANMQLVSNGGAYLGITASTSGYMKLTAQSPYIQFGDTDPGSVMSRLLYGVSSWYIQSDRNGDGSYDSPGPLTLHVGATTSEDYLTLANQVRSPKYCDYNGQNCFGAGDVSTQSVSQPTMQMGSVRVGASLSQTIVTFPKPYTTPPQIETAIQSIFYPVPDYGLSSLTGNFSVQNISKTGFTLNGDVRGADANQYMVVTWFALGQQ
jgi:hypothetical protein